jgi:hypothetical protein
MPKQNAQLLQPPPGEGHSHGMEVRKEAYTMALYVSICLLAALTAVSHPTDEIDAFLIVWGTTLGLAIAHWFAFRVSARLVGAGKVRRHDTDVATAQFAGALAVAVLATVPMLLFADSREFAVVRLTLAGFIGVIGFSVARAGGASRLRSSLYGASILIVAVLVASLKNFLAGH